MEVLSFLKFWRNVIAAADASSEIDDVRNSVFVSDDEETDDENSFFDLVFMSPDRGSVTVGEAVMKKNVRFNESPRDAFLCKNYRSNSKPMSPVTVLRSTPKSRLFMSSFKKPSKMKSSPSNQFSKSSKIEGSGRFAPSALARNDSSRNKMLKEGSYYETSPRVVVSSEKSVPKYMKLIKPFHVKASKKSKLSDSITPLSSPVTVPVNQSPNKFTVTRNIRKSRSAVVLDPPSFRRRDDSLLEQHDGIQGAILHCKKSFNSSPEKPSQIVRFSSDSRSNMRSETRNSCEEQNRYSI